MDDLTGTMVAVHPETRYDPAKMQGKVGIITAADLDSDDFYVSFGKGEQALYPSSSLLVLRDGADVYKDLLTQYKDIGKQDFKDLFAINLLQQGGQTKSIKEAMEIALKNDTLLHYGMVNLQDKLGIVVKEDIAQDKTQEQSKKLNIVR